MRGCSEHTVAANEGYYHVNERGAIVLANSRTPLWGGGCMLTQWVFPCSICGDVRSLCSRICPRLSASPWKGGMRSRADVLSCRFDGEECGHLVGISSSPESRRSTADQRADGLPLRNVILTWTLQRSSHEACPRMSEPNRELNILAIT